MTLVPRVAQLKARIHIIHEDDRPEPSHNIADHTVKLHKISHNKTAQQLQEDAVKWFRSLLVDRPFERTPEQCDKIYELLLRFPTLTDQVDSQVIWKLSSLVQLDTTDEDSMPVFGVTGLHLILHGTVRAMDTFYQLPVDEKLDDKMRTMSPQEVTPQGPRLGVGHWFGTLQKLFRDDEDLNAKLLCVQTAEKHCEFLKITPSDYKRTLSWLKQHDDDEKMSAIQSCTQGFLWPRQPLNQIASLLMWAEYPAGKVIATEGQSAPYIGFLIEGTCAVLRSLQVVVRLKNGTKRTCRKDILIGQLQPQMSFGEESIIKGKDFPMAYSLKTETRVRLGTIGSEDIDKSEEITQQLLLQSGEAAKARLPQMTDAEIQDEYVQQQISAEWKEKKQSVMLDIFNRYGIQPGAGKWKHNV